MPLFDDQATLKLNVLLDVVAQNSKDIAENSKNIATIGDKVDKLYAVVMKTWERQEQLIDETIHHREDPTAHNP